MTAERRPEFPPDEQPESPTDDGAQRIIGVFVCGCAGNISSALDLDAINEQTASCAGVAFVAGHDLLCSPAGKEYLAERMRSGEATHAVVAACSPREHEHDFRQAMSSGGANPYLLQVANIREHCTWVTTDPTAAQDKAQALIRGAVARVGLHERLEQRTIPCNPDLLVIGGGVAGIEAALLAAEEGRQVALVEKGPSIGGKVAQYDDITPSMECAPCMIAPRMSAVRDSERIDVVTDAKLEELVGFLGNFRATVRQRARFVDANACIGCDECSQACPVSVPNDFDHGLSERKAIYVPFPGAVPNCAVVDTDSCRRFGEDPSCSACVEACPVEAVDFEQRDQMVAIEAGAVVVATGFESDVPSGLDWSGYGKLPEVYTSAEVERLCSSTGPTGGRLLKRDGQPPRAIAVVHCVGREQLGYCSGACCEPALKIGHLARHQDAACRVVHLHRELMIAAGPPSRLKARLVEEGVAFNAVDPLAPLSVTGGTNGELRVRYADAAKQSQQLEADMVILVTGFAPAGGGAWVAAMLGMTRREDGFLAADHPLLRSSQSSLDGVYLAGCAGGPRGIGPSIVAAQAAAGQALARVRRGQDLSLDPVTALVDQERCSGCKICLSVCPYRACRRDDAVERARVEQALCRGCGICVGACPSGALRMHHFSDAQLSAEIREVLRD